LKKLGLLLVIYTTTITLSAQNKLLDSLYMMLGKSGIHDTTKVMISVEIVTNEYVVNPEKAKNLANQALGIAQKINYKAGIGYCYRALGLTSWGQGDYEGASVYGFKMLSIFEELNDKRGLARSYSLLGQVHHQWRNVKKANEYYQKALALNRELGNKTQMGYQLNSLGSLYLDAENLDSALLFYVQSLELRESINDEQGMSQSYNNIGLVHSRKGNYEEALVFFNKSLPLTKKLKNKVRLAITTRGIGETFLRMKDYKKSETFLLDALLQMKKLGDKMALLEINETLASLKENQMQYKEALFYERQKRAYQDSMFNEEKSRQLAEMEAKYEDEKKQRVIELLARDNQIKTIWRNSLIVGIIFLVALFALLYRWQQFRQQKNKVILNTQIDLLTSQNKELAEKYKQAILAPDEVKVESQNQRLLSKALQVVERYIDDPFFGVEKMSEELGMSRTNLHRKLKEASHFSPSDFIRNVRLKRAAALLQNRVDIVSQIGFKVGFDDPSNFTKAFKKAYGVSPSEYAKLPS
jgi:AraC-like DNA-binding protein